MRTFNKLLLLCIAILALAVTVTAQNNSCAYTFTYPKAQFSFCVTAWGTLASIQSPIGVDHLDSQNPVEGWTTLITDDGGGSDGGSVIPGLGVSLGLLPAVKQPNGPGTLPLIFQYGSSTNFREIVSAAPYHRTVYLTLVIHSCGDCFWSGTVSRVANVKPDGSDTNTFGHSSFAAFGYFHHGLMLNVDDGAGCAGTDPNGASVFPYFGCGSNTLFFGTGAVFTDWFFSSQRGKPMSMRATYRVF